MEDIKEKTADEILKLKDNVTYQKLNKIGFRYDDFNECFEIEINEDVSISIWWKGNKTLTTFITEGYEYKELASDDYTTIEQLKHWLPQMINLVEKLGDE